MRIPGTTLSAGDFRLLLPILLSQGFGLACGVAGVALISAWVAPGDYGIFGVFVTIAPLGATVVYAGLVRFVARHWRGSTERARLLREVLRSAARKSVWIAAAAVVATLLIAPGNPFAFGVLLFASAVLTGLLQFSQSALQSSREHWRDLAISAPSSLVRSFAPALLYAATGWGILALLLGFTAYGAVGTALGALGLRRYWHVTTTAGSRVLTPEYDGPRFVVLAIAAWVMTGLHRWIVAWQFGAESAGYFTLGANVGGILPTMLGMALMQFQQPQWFAAAANDSADARRRLFRTIDRQALGFTAASVLAAALVQAIMPVLIGTLVGARYANASAFVLAAGCAATALIIGSFYHTGLIAVHRERACTAADLSGATLLAIGALVSARIGMDWFVRWLVVSPLVPWLVNRRVAWRAIA